VPAKLERILILCKTYPSPQSGPRGTSCVAGITDNGEMRRLFPVPFPLLADEQQFKKWQWVSARVEKAPADHRPESHKIYVDTIVCDAKPLPTSNGWQERRAWLSKVPVFADFAAAEDAHQKRGTTLALIKPRAPPGTRSLGSG
jgi:hypothetical protein